MGRGGLQKWEGGGGSSEVYPYKMGGGAKQVFSPC